MNETPFLFVRSYTNRKTLFTVIFFSKILETLKRAVFHPKTNNKERNIPIDCILCSILQNQISTETNIQTRIPGQKANTYCIGNSHFCKREKQTYSTKKNGERLWKTRFFWVKKSVAFQISGSFSRETQR